MHIQVISLIPTKSVLVAIQEAVHQGGVVMSSQIMLHNDETHTPLAHIGCLRTRLINRIRYQ